MEPKKKNNRKAKVKKLAFHGDTQNDNHSKDVQEKSDSNSSHELSKQQINMFKQVFKLLDRDSTGSVNADALFHALKEISIDISLEEIVAVLNDLDRDGNGEIDLDEFLHAMSETDRYIDTMLTQPEDTEERMPGEYSKRQTLFFTAITSFALKNSLGEIERYYANKVRQAPHVIGCYSAGVRLIGLNDKQLEQEMLRMRKEAKNHSSPYAQPLPFIKLKRRRNVKKPEVPIEKKDSSSSENEETEPGQIRIRRRIHKGESSEILKMLQELAKHRNPPKGAAGTEAREQTVHANPKRTVRVQGKVTRSIFKNQRGWVIPRIELGLVSLPIIKVEQGHSREFNIDDMPDIKERVTEAMDDYYSSQRKARSDTATKHWHKLGSSQIKSRKLRDMFKECYRAYLPRDEEEVFVTCHWIPQPRYTARQAHPKSLDATAETSKASARRLIKLAEKYKASSRGTGKTSSASSPASPMPTSRPSSRAQSTPPYPLYYRPHSVQPSTMTFTRCGP